MWHGAGEAASETHLSKRRKPEKIQVAELWNLPTARATQLRVGKQENINASFAKITELLQ